MRFPAFFASLMTDSLIIGSFLVLRTCKQSLNDVIQKIELLQDYQTHVKHRSIADCDCGCKKSRRQWPQSPHELFSNGFGCISSYSRTAAFQGGFIGKQYGRKDGDDVRVDIPNFIRQPHSCRHVSFPQKKSICGRSVSTWLKSTQDCRFKSDKRQTRCWQRFEGRNSCRCSLTNITPLSYFFCNKADVLCGGSRGGALFPLILRPNWGSKSRYKMFIWDSPPPHVRVWMTGGPLSEGLDPQLVPYALNKPFALISANPLTN